MKQKSIINILLSNIFILSGIFINKLLSFISERFFNLVLAVYLVFIISIPYIFRSNILFNIRLDPVSCKFCSIGKHIFFSTKPKIGINPAGLHRRTPDCRMTGLLYLVTRKTGKSHNFSKPVCLTLAIAGAIRCTERQ
jgi:hypothetical protein